VQDLELNRWKPIVWMDRILDCVIVLCLITVALLMFVQVVMRYVFKSPIMGLEELCYFPTTWLYLFGAVKASSEKNHLVARVLEIFLKKRRSVYVLRSIAAVFTSGVLMWLTYWGYDYLKYALRRHKQTDMLFLPWIYVEATVFISILFMLIYTIIEFVEYMRLYAKTPADTAVDAQ